MYIVSTSFVIDPSVHDPWFNFFKTNFMKYLTDNGFEKNVLTRLLSEEAVTQYTYSLQVYVDNLPEYKRFMEEALSEYIKISVPLFGVNALYFSSLLKMVEY